jgi:hypothetical protein
LEHDLCQLYSYLRTCSTSLPASVRMTFRRHHNRYSFLSRSSQIESLRVTTVSISFKFIRRLLLRWSATCSPPRQARRQYQIRFISLLRITSTWNIPYIHIKNMIDVHLKSHSPSGTLPLSPLSLPLSSPSLLPLPSSSLSTRHCRCLNVTVAVYTSLSLNLSQWSSPIFHDVFVQF